MAEPEPLMSVAELAKQLNRGTKGLYNYIRRRELGEESGVYRIGRMVRIDHVKFLHADHNPTKRGKAQ